MSRVFSFILAICLTLSSAQSPVPATQSSVPATQSQVPVTQSPVLATQSPQHSGALNFLPANCSGIISQGTTNPYNNTSIAGIFQSVLCSVKSQLSQCIADNQQNMISGDNALQWAMGVSFNKNVFDLDVQDLCNRLPAVAADLECFRGMDATGCSSFGLISAITNIFNLTRTGSMPLERAQTAICGAVQTFINCWTPPLSSCTKGAGQFLLDHYRLYFGKCKSGGVLEALPPSIRNSIFVTCAIDSFSNIIEDLVREVATVNITDINSLIPTITAFMSHLCIRTEELSNCIVQRAKNTTDRIDAILLHFVNVSNLKDALDLLCQSGRDVAAASRCFADVPMQAKYCGSVYQFKSIHGAGRPEVPDNPRMFTILPTISATDFGSHLIDTYLRKFCPLIKDMTDCTYLPLSQCVPTLTSTMNRFVRMLMTDRCRQVADVGIPEINLNPLASVFIKCQIPLSTKIFGKGNPSCTSAICPDTIDIVQRSMDVACRNAEWYSSCLDERLQSSNNIIDRFFSHIVDFSSSVNRTQVISSVCGKIEDIKAQVSCMINQVTSVNNSFQGCIANSLQVWTLLGNVTELAKMDGVMVRSRFCTPIQKILSCARSSIGSCSDTVDSLMESVPKAVLRTDCGGVRLQATTPDITVSTNSQTGTSVGVTVKGEYMTILLSVIIIPVYKFYINV